MSKYKCPKCKKILERDNNKKWISSICSSIGERVRLKIIKPKQR